MRYLYIVSTCIDDVTNFGPPIVTASFDLDAVLDENEREEALPNKRFRALAARLLDGKENTVYETIEPFGVTIVRVET